MIVVGTTLTTFAMGKEETWGNWLLHAEELKKSHPDGVLYFAAIEIDANGISMFNPLIEKLLELSGTYISFMLNDGRTTINSRNRLRHIVMGRNIVHDFAVEQNASHILFLDSDVEPDPLTLPKLLEMDHPLVGGNVGSYALGGPPVDKYSFPVQSHMNTAGYLLVRKEVFNRLRWRWEYGKTDDPCFHDDARELLGVETFVRKDCVGAHYPRVLVPIEKRGYDMNVAN